MNRPSSWLSLSVVSIGNPHNDILYEKEKVGGLRHHPNSPSGLHGPALE